MKLRFPHVPTITVALAVGAISSLSVLAEDPPPVDAAAILKALHTMKDQQMQTVKAEKLRALQQVQGAASDSGRALEMWEDAVRATQFDGASREATQFRDWKEKEGDALKEKEGVAALHLYFTWLTLTLQHSSGVTVRELLPTIVSYTRDALADQTAMDIADDTAKKEKEIDPGRRGGPRGLPQPHKMTDDQIKKVHDQIVKQSLSSSIVVQWLRIGDLLVDSKPKTADASGAAVAASWELVPGNVDGIYQKTILPELRAERDPHVVDYWDMKLRQESDAATRSKLAFEADKFNQVRMPQILWSRAQDVFIIGQKNRAIADMFKLIKGYPAHPDAAAWMSTLEADLLPPAAAAAGASVAPSAPVTFATPSAPAAPAEVLPSADVIVVPGAAPIPAPVSGVPAVPSPAGTQ